jgi:hypothetical protein
MNKLADVYAQHLEETLKSADRYLLFAASAALAFAVFSFAKGNGTVDFTLAGFPLHMNAVLAQVLLYFFSVGAFWLADHAVIHCRDLVRKLEDDPERVVAIMSYPTTLTLGPMRWSVTVVPSLLLMLGVVAIWRLETWSVGIRWLDATVSLLALSFGGIGLAVGGHAVLYLKRWFLDTERPPTPGQTV